MWAVASWLRNLWLRFINNSNLETIMLPLVERGYVPDCIIRYGMRLELTAQSEALLSGGVEKQSAVQCGFIEQLKTMQIAINQPDANKQHYEVPTELYQACLGPWLKYSCGLWPRPDTTFEQSEVEMLELYCARAELAALGDDFKLFDLGCGWGSVTLYMATKYPNCTIVSLSNSATQRKYILETAASRNLTNITVYTGDINEWVLPEEHMGTFDRCISIEMFEHMKNYGKLLGKISLWLKPHGKLLVHIFTHTVCPYHFEKGWMAENFFTGGTMPSDSLLLHFQSDLTIDAHWRLSGEHYQKTSEAWLKRLDANKTALLPVLAETYGKGNELKWFINWRLFYLACAELWGFRGGEEWIVSHYRFVKPSRGE